MAGYRQILVKTPNHSLTLELFWGYTDTAKVKTKREEFRKLCEKGCRNYGRKPCCPPFAPPFEKLTAGNPRLLVALLRLNLDQLSSEKPHFRHRIGNAVLKPRLEGLLRKLETITGTRMLASGSCRLCRPCPGNPCKRPSLMRYSLEATGVDCLELCDSLFGLPLEWFNREGCPSHTAVLCAIPFNAPVSVVEEGFVRALEWFKY